MANGVLSSVCFSGIGANSGLGRVISGASILLLKEELVLCWGSELRRDAPADVMAFPLLGA